MSEALKNDLETAEINRLRQKANYMEALWKHCEKQRDDLRGALEQLLETMELPPDRNCSCHISPPCNDCVDYSGIREAIKRAEKVLAEVKGQS